MASHSNTPEQPGVKGWIEHRLPIFSFVRDNLGTYPTPRNLSYWWNFGSLAGICLVIQILTGVVLAMHYTPHTAMAFDSVENIMRNVNYGWLLRYMHAVGASMFFVVVYIHIFRGLYFGSYKAPREILWWLGIVIFLLMMATAFMGYTLPWGQMSLWGATVITNLFSAVPVVGESIVKWLWGGYSVDNPTLNRFFALHYLFPFLIVGVVVLHLVALHQHGSNNPLGVDVKGRQDTIPFHPYYTIKDFFGFGVFFIVFAWFVFFAPNSLGHPDNYIPGNPLVTPPHIVPEWYFLPFYAILRAVPDKLGGVLAMFASILILFVLPWLDRSKVRSATFRPMYKWFFWLFVANCLLLGYVGGKPAGSDTILAFQSRYLPDITIGRLATIYYFAHFLLILPWLSRVEKPLPLPISISQPVLRSLVFALVGVFGLVGFAGGAQAAGDAKHPKQLEWHFDGMFGAVDDQAAQRGLQVYKEVCAACHGLKRVPFRSLSAIGFSEAEIKALAATYTYSEIGDDGEPKDRPGRPSDYFKSPYANEKASRAANNGAYPPDLSLIIKARHDGANYVYSLLTGYQDAPADMTMGDGMHYNPYFPGGQIAMNAPLSDGQVTYADGTQASVDQMARDVVHFLQWAAEPEMEQRKQMGLKVLLFLAVMTGFLYAAKRRIWKDVAH